MRGLAPVAAIIEKDTRHAQELKKQLIQLDAKQNGTDFDIAELIYELDENGHLQELGYPGLEHFVRENLKMSVRKARYLKKYMVFGRALDIPRATLEKAGSSKLTEITTLELGTEYLDTLSNETKPVNPEIKSLIERAAEGMKLEDVKNAVNELKGKSTEEFTWFNNRVRATDKKDYIEEGMRVIRAKVGNTIDIETKEEKPISDGECTVIAYTNLLQDPNWQAQELGTEGDHQDEFVDEPVVDESEA